MIIMDFILSKNTVDLDQGNETVLRMLDRGIDDMEAERELTIDEAFDKVTELRNIRRNARA